MARYFGSRAGGFGNTAPDWLERALDQYYIDFIPRKLGAKNRTERDIGFERIEAQESASRDRRADASYRDRRRVDDEQ